MIKSSRRDCFMFKPFVENACNDTTCNNCTVRRMQICFIKKVLSKKNLTEDIVDIILWKVYEERVHNLKRKRISFYG